MGHGLASTYGDHLMAGQNSRLDWLGLFVASWVVPFVLDDVHRLTYFSSLAFWLVPTLLLLPRFLEYTDSGGRRRSAMLLTTVSVVAMGVLLDVVFGHVILQFDESATANYIAWLTVPVLRCESTHRRVRVLRDGAHRDAPHLRVGQ